MKKKLHINATGPPAMVGVGSGLSQRKDVRDLRKGGINMNKHQLYPSTQLSVELLTTKQAADFLKVSPKTLERMRVEGRGPSFVKIGRSVRYRLEDLQAFVDDNIFSSTSEFQKIH